VPVDVLVADGTEKVQKILAIDRRPPVSKRAGDEWTAGALFDNF
jgi:hypothetical protein